METTETALTDTLRKLNDEYIFKVNQAAEHDNWDLVQELTDAYFEDVQDVITTSSDQPNQPNH
jgi:TorA maturation chaperone TorD